MSKSKRTNELMQRAFQVRAAELPEGGETGELWVEGRAVVFEEPTVLWSEGDTDYTEQIARSAFTDCQMEDVIFNYNHGGKVLARTRNNTLELDIREDGLYCRARLDGTAEGRALYEEIQGGYIDRMSFRFSIREESYDRENHKWTVQRISRLYDVSAVDIPAYESTSISARRAQADADKAQHLRRMLELRCRI